LITHIVFFKLKDRSPESIEQARAVLAAMEGNVPMLRDLEVGVDVLKTERSYDIALVTRFDSLADLDAYQKHPYHVEVANYMAGVRDSAVAVDYES
jgi:hypothetical protein